MALTCVARFSAAADTVACQSRLSGRSDDFSVRLQDYDLAAWRRYLAIATNSTRQQTLWTHASLVPPMPPELKQTLLTELAKSRMRRQGNKRQLDLAFNLLDRADLLVDSLQPCTPASGYRGFFEHEARYFNPAYDADLVLAVAEAVRRALPNGASVAFGGSFVNARADITRDGWDLDFLSSGPRTETAALLKSAVEGEFIARGLKVPRIDLHDLPKDYFASLGSGYFDLTGGEPLGPLHISPPAGARPSAVSIRF